MGYPSSLQAVDCDWVDRWDSLRKEAESRGDSPALLTKARATHSGFAMVFRYPLKVEEIVSVMFTDIPTC